MRRARKVMMWACCAAPAAAAMLMTGVGTANATTLAVTHFTPGPGGPSYFPGGPDGFPGGNQGPGGYQGGPGGYQGGPGPGPQQSCSRWQLEEWNLNGSNPLSLTYNSSTFTYAVTFKQKGSCLTGTLTDTRLSSPNLALTGEVSGNNVTFSVTYPTTVQGTRTFAGRIHRDGDVTGSWSETGIETGTKGPWTLASQADPACPPWYHYYGGQRECSVR